MPVLLIEGKRLNKQGGSEWIGRGGGSSVVTIPLWWEHDIRDYMIE